MSETLNLIIDKVVYIIYIYIYIYKVVCIIIVHWNDDQIGLVGYWHTGSNQF